MTAQHFKELWLTLKGTYKLTHKAVCEILGCSDVQYYRVIHGQRTISRKQAILYGHRIRQYIAREEAL